MTNQTISAAGPQTAVNPKLARRKKCVHPDVIEAARFVTGLDTSQDIDRIGDELYRWYVNLTPLAATDVPPSNAVALTPASAFRHAHAGTQRFEPGWTVSAHTGWGAVAARSGDGIERHFRAGQFRTLGGNHLPAIGEAILGEIAWSWIEEDTGFWLTRRGVWEPAGSTALVRVYFNASPLQACTLIRELTGLLLRDGCSFMLKTPAARQHSGRCDAVVLYLGNADWNRLQMVITKHNAPIMTRTPTPRFAARIANGVAWSVGPLDGESFGKLRADLIASAVHRRSFGSVSECVAALVVAFETAGLSAAQPHLEPR